VGDLLAGVGEQSEPVQVQAFVAELAVQAFDEACLGPACAARPDAGRPALALLAGRRFAGISTPSLRLTRYPGLEQSR
jgi:hypothetical protein